MLQQSLFELHAALEGLQLPPLDPEEPLDPDDELVDPDEPLVPELLPVRPPSSLKTTSGMVLHATRAPRPITHGARQRISRW